MYVGASSQDYNKILLSQQPVHRTPYTPYSGTGAALSVLSGRVAYTCNMRGPSIVCDTGACIVEAVVLLLQAQNGFFDIPCLSEELRTNMKTPLRVRYVF